MFGVVKTIHQEPNPITTWGIDRECVEVVCHVLILSELSLQHIPNITKPCPLTISLWHNLLLGNSPHPLKQPTQPSPSDLVSWLQSTYKWPRVPRGQITENDDHHFEMTVPVLQNSALDCDAKLHPHLAALPQQCTVIVLNSPSAENISLPQHSMIMWFEPSYGNRRFFFWLLHLHRRPHMYVMTWGSWMGCSLRM